MIYGYIVGQHFMEKEFNTMEEATTSINRIANVAHKEKIMYVFSERRLTEKECLMLNVVQQEI